MSLEYTRKKEKFLNSLGFNLNKKYFLFKISSTTYKSIPHVTLPVFTVIGPGFIDCILHKNLFSILCSGLQTSYVTKYKMIDKYSVMIYTKNSVYIFTQEKSHN